MFVYVCVSMRVFGGPQGPVLMSYLCAFLTRARCSAHGTVILGWPCSAARLCRLLYLWHHHHLAVYFCVCVCECVHSPVCAFQEGGSAGGLTQEANTVYISIMNQVRERNTEREREKGKRQGGRDGESHFPSAVFYPLGNQPLWCLFPLFCICLFPPFISLLGLIRWLLSHSAHH